jgi:restriction endonuclease S subunit
MRKRVLLQTAMLLAATVNLSEVAASCFPPAKGIKTPLDVLECLQSVLDTQQKQIDSQQKRIAELEKENQALQQKMAAITVSRDGNVGIGTTEPKTKLDVAGNATAIRLTEHGGYDWLFQNNGGELTIKNDVPLYVLHLTSNGNVGIGTTSPSSKLHIQGGSMGSRSNGLTIQGASASSKCTLYVGHDGAGCTDGGSRLYTGASQALCVICD